MAVLSDGSLIVNLWIFEPTSCSGYINTNYLNNWKTLIVKLDSTLGSILEVRKMDICPNLLKSMAYSTYQGTDLVFFGGLHHNNAHSNFFILSICDYSAGFTLNIGEFYSFVTDL